MQGNVNGNAAWLCKWKCGVAVTFKEIEVWTVIGYNIVTHEKGAED